MSKATLTIKLDVEERDRLRMLAKQSHRDMSKYVRHLIAQDLERARADDAKPAA